MSVPPDQMPGGPGAPQTRPQRPQRGAQTPSQPGPQGQPGLPQQGATQPGPQQGGAQPGQQGGKIPMADDQSRKLGAKAIENMLATIYGEEWDNLIRELSGTDQERIPETVGRIVATMYIMQEAFAQAAGKELPQTIAVDVGRQMVQEMFIIMESQNIYKAPKEQKLKDVSKALMYAAKYYRMHLESEGRYDEQGAAQLGQAIRSGAYDKGGQPGEGGNVPTLQAGGPEGGQGQGAARPGNLLSSAREAARGKG